MTLKKRTPIGVLFLLYFTVIVQFAFLTILPMVIFILALPFLSPVTVMIALYAFLNPFFFITYPLALILLHRIHSSCK